jgi:alpha-glucuronidase
MAEDGSNLWLRYAPLNETTAARYRPLVRGVVVEGNSPTASIIREELASDVKGLLGVDLGNPEDAKLSDGSIVVGTSESSALVRRLGWTDELARLGPEGFILRKITIENHPVIVIASMSEAGALYGAFHLLRLMQTGEPIERINISERPRVKLRLLNHWDNLNGTIERGYAGRSLWQWNELPDKLNPRYAEYARANASIGINGAVLNNVNADVRILTPDYLTKVAAIANVWRPYGIRAYLAVNFATPRTLGNLPTADPLDPTVAQWWKNKVEEIYKFIPDFGGFLVKANSEGQPGPQDYKRTHADGANVMADALAPHNGVVIWRAFVYNESVDPDRAKRAYIEFMALDAKFKPNALVQVKNGPVDFQPREPFHPLFGGLKKAPALAELQITQEYLGQSKHLVFLGTMWKEFLDADTFAPGAGSTVGKAIEGTLTDAEKGYLTPFSGMAGVANTGSDADWCGHHFSQANWYAFGRLAWDHDIPAEHIAEEWTRMTWGNDPQVVETIRRMLMSSRETYVNYTMPLGLHHLIGGDHYAPMPWNDRAQRRDWTATYFHHAGKDGIGFDRTRKGSNAVEQYHPPLYDVFDDPAKCPEKLLLWFHHLPWDHKMNSGQTLWKELCEKYYLGHEQVLELQKAWISLAEKIDAERHKAVLDRLAIQVADSEKWRDQILQYFQQFSGMEIGPGSTTKPT